MDYSKLEPNSPCNISSHCIKLPFSDLKPGFVIEVHGHHFTVYQKTEVNKKTVLGIFHAEGNMKVLHQIAVNDTINTCEFKDVAFDMVRYGVLAASDFIAADYSC